MRGGGRERVEGGQSLLTLKSPSSSHLIPLAFQVAPLPCRLLPLPQTAQWAWLSLGSSHGVPVFSLVAEMGLLMRLHRLVTERFLSRRGWVGNRGCSGNSAALPMSRKQR